MLGKVKVFITVLDYKGVVHYEFALQGHIVNLYSFRRVRKFAKSDYQLRYVCPSVLTHATTRLPLGGFSRNLILEYFSELCGENSSFITVGQE